MHELYNADNGKGSGRLQQEAKMKGDPKVIEVLNAIWQMN